MTLSKSVPSLALALLLGGAAAPPAVTPIRLHPSNPHYFEFRGQPTVLVTSGEHYGAVMNLDFDHATYLNRLQAEGLNLTRTFSGQYVEGWGAPWNTLNTPSNRYVTPWARSATPGYADGGNKFDLNAWDTAYFDRLKSFVSQAGSRGIVVELVLFCAYYGDNEWNLSPLKSTNNVNGIGGVGWNQTYDLSNGALTAAEDAMVQKIVTELNPYDNVYYEICNEPYFGNATQDWHSHMADKIVATEATLPNRHLIAHNIANGSGRATLIPAVSILNYHYANPPDAVAQNDDYNRVIAFDETGFRGSGDLPYRTEAWQFLLAGGAVYDNLDWSYTVDAENGTSTAWDHNLGGGGPAIQHQLGILKSFIHGFNFIAMAPNNGVVTGGIPGGASIRALVESGAQYAIHITGGSQANLQVNLPAGSYKADWVNTKTGAVDGTSTFAHAGGNRTISSPSYSEDIALKIVLTGAPPPPPPPPPPGSGTFYRAINLNGGALTIDGHAWEGSNAANYSFNGSSFANQGVTLDPATDADRATMIRSSIWNSAGSNVTMSGVPAGTYQVFLYVWEDNFSTTYSVMLEGQTVQSNYASGTGGHWDRLGPWNAHITDGTIDVLCTAGDANLSGLEVWQISLDAPPGGGGGGGGGGGPVLREYWTGIGGTTVADLTQQPSFPDSPSGTSWEAAFEAPTDWADNYGTRLRATLTAPASGAYTFWIAGDDNCELWLSTDEWPAHKVRIAWVPGWTSSREWTKYPEQQSAPITLTGGATYYIEALQKEGGGGDNLAAGWSIPGGAVEQPIPGARLSAVDPALAADAGPGSAGASGGGNGGGGGGGGSCGLVGLEGLLLLLLRRRRTT
jgi:hypothetical protein